MPKKTPNKQYNVASPDSLPVRVATYQRRRMFSRFLKALSPGADDRVLDVGATSDDTFESSNYLEAWYSHRSMVTAVGIDDASFLETKFPGVTFVHGNATALPFEDESFDYVHSSAVLEHVGAQANQLVMIRECARVARKGFFLTTPNRWFPIEFHTTLPLLHWLPKETYRALLRRIGMDFFAQESNLNLLSLSDLNALTKDIASFDIRIEAVPLLGWPSNLLVIGRRRAAGPND